MIVVVEWLAISWDRVLSVYFGLGLTTGENHCKGEEQGDTNNNCDDNFSLGPRPWLNVAVLPNNVGWLTSLLNLNGVAV